MDVTFDSVQFVDGVSQTTIRGPLKGNVDGLRWAVKLDPHRPTAGFWDTEAYGVFDGAIRNRGNVVDIETYDDCSIVLVYLPDDSEHTIDLSDDIEAVRVH